MEDTSEVVGVIWGILVSNKEGLSALDVAKECGLSVLEAQSGLTKLTINSLALKNIKDGVAFYTPVTTLSSLLWAKAIEIGVPLDVLERNGRLNVKEKKEALLLASDGRLDLIKKKEAKSRIKKREKILLGEAATLAAFSDLGLLLRDTQSLIEEASSKKYTAALLLKMKSIEDNTSKSLKNLTREIYRKNGGKDE